MATGAPGTNGVWQYGEDDSEATFSALLNKVASTADTQIGTDRGRLTTLEARKLSGLVPVVPSTIANSAGSSSLNTTTGLVTFTGTGTISLNGVFTSAYKNYRINFDLSAVASAGGDLGFRLRKTGTDSSSTNYYTAGTWNNSQNGANTYYNVGSGVGYFGNVVTNTNLYTSATMEISTPQVTGVTKVRSSMSSLSPAGIPAVYNVAVMNDQNETFDGITFFGVSGGLITGTVKVYGWN